MRPTGNKELGNRVTIALFTGTGNTLSIVKTFAEELEKLGRNVSLFAMESEAPLSLPEGASLGLAFPVACFSTYPTVWRFIDSLPDGGGRGAFLLATMGGLAMGMDGPVRKVVESRGYIPLGSQFLIMPGNYNNTTIPAEANAKRVGTAGHVARRFAKALAEGRSSWGGGTPLVSLFWARFAHTRMPWRGFYKVFPLTVNRDLCTGCGLCRDFCPERNISMENGLAHIGDRCESCQRCIAFCPANAIFVPGKPAQQYRGASIDELSALVR